MYKLKKGNRIAGVNQDIQLYAYLSSGWELIPENTEGAHESDAPLFDESVVLETDAVAPKRRGRQKKQ